MTTTSTQQPERRNWKAIGLPMLALVLILAFFVTQFDFSTPNSGVLNQDTGNMMGSGGDTSVLSNSTKTPFQPVQPTETLAPSCPEAGAVMPQYRQDEQGEHWFNSTVKWSTGMPLGVKFPELLIQQFGKPGSRTPEQIDKFTKYAHDLVRLGQKLDSSKNWYLRLQDFLNAYIQYGTSTCFRFPTDAEVNVYAETSNWGLPVEMVSDVVVVEPGPVPGPDLTAPSNAQVLSAEPDASSQNVIVIDPNKPGQQTTWDWIPLGPSIPTSASDTQLKLPSKQGPGIATEPEGLSVEELTNRSWAIPLVIRRDQCPDLNLSSVILEPKDNPLGLSYVVNFSPWVEYYVGPCKKIRLVRESTWVNQSFILVEGYKIAGFNEQLSVYTPPTSTPAQNLTGGNPEPAVVDIDLGTLARNYGRSGVAVDLSCNGDTVNDYGRVIFRNAYGTFATNLLVYMGNYAGPCSSIEIVPTGEKPGMSIFGVDGMVLAGFVNAYNLTPVGPNP